MLRVVACACGSSEDLARKTIKKAGCSNWLQVPIYTGKSKVNEFVASLPPIWQDSEGLDKLLAHISNLSSYVCIVGYNETEFRWADIRFGDIKSRLDGELIAEKFGN